MRLIQLYGYVGKYDGVSNGIFALADFFDSLGYENYIYVLSKEEGFSRKNLVVIKELSEEFFEKDDIVLNNFAYACDLNDFVENLQCRKILLFHNITYPDFFYKISNFYFNSCLAGHYQAKRTVGKYNKAIVLSEFSRSTLVGYGWQEKDVFVFPYYKLHLSNGYSQKIVEKYSDDKVNVLFTGRVSPHKKIEDVIASFGHYQKHFNSNSRLFLVGNDFAMPNYTKALVNFVIKNKINDVVFTGMVIDEELESYYKLADVFLCMSEHEGFCIPLVDAMARNVPVVAYSATAVSDTMGNAGVLLSTKDCDVVAAEINKLVTEKKYRENIITIQNNYLKEFAIEKYSDKIKQFIEAVSQEQVLDVHSDMWLEVEPEDDKDSDSNINLHWKEHSQVVLYGFGKVGKLLFDVLLKNGISVRAICDNNSKEESYNGVPILKHSECMEKYPNEAYLVSVQDGFVRIISSLLISGIKSERVYRYENIHKKIVQ